MEHTLSLLLQAHEGDKMARDTLVKENIGLIWSIVRRFLNRGVEKEDLFQIGSIGLMKAIDKFDPNYQVQFSTYAVPMISGEIKRYLRDDGMIKVSRMLKEISMKASMEREKWIRRVGREPQLEELAKMTGVEPEELVLAMEALTEVESLSQTIYDGDGTQIQLEDRLSDKKDEQEELMNRMLLSQLLEMLSSEEKQIIRMRYFEEKTQTQIARELGMSQVQVSRAEKKILKKMKENSEYHV